MAECIFREKGKWLTKICQNRMKMGNYVMTLTSGTIEGKQLKLCRGYIIFCDVDCFCLQEKKEDEKKSNASAMM